MLKDRRGTVLTVFIKRDEFVLGLSELSPSYCEQHVTVAAECPVAVVGF